MSPLFTTCRYDMHLGLLTEAATALARAPSRPPHAARLAAFIAKDVEWQLSQYTGVRNAARLEQLASLLEAYVPRSGEPPGAAQLRARVDLVGKTSF